MVPKPESEASWVAKRPQLLPPPMMRIAEALRVGEGEVEVHGEGRARFWGAKKPITPVVKQIISIMSHLNSCQRYAWLGCVHTGNNVRRQSRTLIIRNALGNKCRKLFFKHRILLQSGKAPLAKDFIADLESSHILSAHGDYTDNVVCEAAGQTVLDEKAPVSSFLVVRVEACDGDLNLDLSWSGLWYGRVVDSDERVAEFLDDESGLRGHGEDRWRISKRRTTNRICVLLASFRSNENLQSLRVPFI